MKIVWCLGASVFLCAVLTSNGSSISKEETVEGSRIEKRAGGGKLTRYALKKLVRELRSNKWLRDKAEASLRKWSGGRLGANDIIDVIEGVANRLDRYQAAGCNYFSDVGVTLGIPRNIGYQICNVAIDLLSWIL